jgi:hypothetical protein
VTPDRYTEATDAEIGGLVYELYGLTEEEIAIVEGTGEVQRGARPDGRSHQAVAGGSWELNGRRPGVGTQK